MRNWATTGWGRPLRPVKLRNPNIDDSAFTVTPLLDIGFDDIETAELDVALSVRESASRRFRMLDETVES